MMNHSNPASILLALLAALDPLALAAACVENSEAVEVRAYRLPEGPPAYAFMVINNADAPILSISIGGPPHIPINRDNIPTSVGAPTGWEGNYFFEDNHPVQYMQFLWEAKDPEMRILPGASLSGFSIQLPYPVGTEERPLLSPEGHPEFQTNLRDIPFRIVSMIGECHSGFLSVEHLPQTP